MDDKTKSILAIMAIIVSLSGIFLYRGVVIYTKYLDDTINEVIRQTNVLMSEVIKNSNIIYDVHLTALTDSPEIISAFAQRDRQRLYNLVLPRHRSLKTENPHYSNMHFHLPSGHSFLRMHKPGEYGDDLRSIRPIIMAVHLNKKTVSGYEIGKHGLFYRVAKPMFMDGTYIGALEIGIKAEEVADNIQRVLDIKTARYIPDSLLNDGFRSYLRDEIRTGGVSVNAYGNRAMFRKAASAYDFDARDVQRLEIDGKPTVVFSSGNLKDFRGVSTARFLVVKDISADMADYKSFLYRSVFLTLLLIAGAFLILQFSFGTYINKIIELNRTLEKKVRDRTRDLQSVSDQLSDANAELVQIFNTAADGMRVIDENFRVLRVNDTFAGILGNDKRNLEGKLCHQDFSGRFCFSDNCTLTRIMNGEERIEMDVEKKAGSGERRSFILTATPFRDAEGKIIGVVENFKDITQRKKAFRAIEAHEAYLKTMLERQTVDLKKAKSVMTLINQSVPRYIPVSETCRLFTDVISVPCHAEGGDHLFVQPLAEGLHPRTSISLKDQSGHEVNCILRSIYTDLLHNAALFKYPRADTGEVATRLNRQLCASGFFEPDDFFTAVNAQIDHRTLVLEYVSAGHPPMILIRGRDVRLIPDAEEGISHLPIPFIETAEYAASRFQMETGDQLILYTDGLTEMGLKRLNTTLSAEDLRELVQGIVNRFHAENNGNMPVSGIIRKLLETITVSCGETVSPETDGTAPVNTSSDDVSIIGIELEGTGRSEILSIVPRNDDEVSGFIREIRDRVRARLAAETITGLMEKIATIIEEAVLNAWKHGNRKDPGKSIMVRLSFINDIVIEVIDQGRGFDYNTLPDPTRIDNIQKTDGRGVFIIRQFADHVHWAASGSHIFISLKPDGNPAVPNSSGLQPDITNLWKRVSY